MDWELAASERGEEELVTVSRVSRHFISTDFSTSVSFCKDLVTLSMSDNFTTSGDLTPVSTF